MDRLEDRRDLNFDAPDSQIRMRSITLQIRINNNSDTANHRLNYLHADTERIMKIAIVSSPRSGNTWLRSLVRDIFSLNEIAVHNFKDVYYIPERCVLQLHWYREPNFQEFIKSNGFSTICLSRNPLDVLISVLHFVRYEPETSKWLGGNGAIPADLAAHSPASDQFLDFALSFGAENLLSVTYQWWQDESAIKVRYEDLVRDTAGTLMQIAQHTDGLLADVDDSIRKNSIDVFKVIPNRHGWQGTPGLWKELIPADHAEKIFARHRRNFEICGYSFEANTATRQSAENRWNQLKR